MSTSPADISTLFAEHAGSQPDERLGERLLTIIDSARAAWPAVALGDERFVRYLAERLADEEDPAAALHEICASDLYLACGCAQGEAQALEAFDEHILSAVGEAVRHLDPSPAFASEVAQLTRVKLLLDRPDRAGKITSYRGRGMLRSWVRVAAVRTGIELCRQNKPLKSDDDLADSEDWNEDPEVAQIRLMYREEFSSAFKAALARLSSRERNVLRMNLLEGLNIGRIGTMYRVHRATVARWIAAARSKLLDQTRHELKSRLQLSATEFESLLVVVRSHLDLSLERLLDPSADPDHKKIS